MFRLAFASARLLPVIFYDRPHFDRSEWAWVLAAAVLGVPVQFLVQSKGLSLTTVSHASLMVGTLPMLLAIAAVVFAGERLHLGGWLAVASSTLGAALIALSSKEASGPAYASMRGNLLIVLSMFAAIGWILISKRLMRRHSAVMVSYHLLGRYCPAGGCGHDHIGLPFRPLLAPSMDCHRGGGICSLRRPPRFCGTGN